MVKNFVSWLIQVGKSEKTARNYAQAIDGSISNWARDAGLVQHNFLEVDSAMGLDKLIDEIRRLEIFQVRNAKGKGMYSAALKQYRHYWSDVLNDHIVRDIEEILTDESIPVTERPALISTRVGQGKFREGLIDYWSGCAVTGYPNTRFLQASHIKPWRESKGNERLDPFNGLLLMPNLDKVFDLGYITFTESGSIIVSNYVEQPQVLGVVSDMHIEMADSHQEYMAYHREKVFKEGLH